jgi:serine/threonine protein phosphatase PrpC
MDTLSWQGSRNAYLDTPKILSCRDMLLGAYGGNTSAGAYKNEDAALLWSAPEYGWHLAVLCDAHVTSESADLVIQALEAEKSAITAALASHVEVAIPHLQRLVVELFLSNKFRSRCQAITGETACLICVQKEQFLWWFSIGDCTLYLFHPELAQMGQYMLNQRNFYEWVGQVNTFNLAVPCFASGVRELRQGFNHILMVTDGLLEAGTRPFAMPSTLYDLFVGECKPTSATIEECIQLALQRVHAELGRDSATLIHWCYESAYPCAYPTG